MKSISSLVFCLSLLFQSCSKKPTLDQSHNWTDATIINKTGLDGCGWVLQLHDGDYLEPTNLGDFDIELKDGKAVFVKYSEAAGMGSICMIGMIVEIKDIKEK